jgi:hypothetical protein
MKNKNLLAENMLRYRAKNLSETAKKKIVKLAEIISEQDAPNGSSNITLYLQDIMAGKQVAKISGRQTFYSFPLKPGAGQGGAVDLPGDVATYNKQSAIYKVGGNQYIVVGNIGIIDKTGQQIQNVQPQAFKVTMSPGIGTGYGNAVRFTVKPSPVTDTSRTIAALLKASVPQNQRKEGVDLSQTSKTFIDNMVRTFKLIGLANDMSNMDDLYKQVKTYI